MTAQRIFDIAVLYVLFAKRGMPTAPHVLEWATFIVRSNRDAA